MNRALIGLVCIVGAAVLTAEGQGFSNLNFESAHVVPVSTNVFVYIDAVSALPGWSASLGTNRLSQIPYNPSTTVPPPPIALYYSPKGTGIIAGNFEIRLGENGFGQVGSISQTGLVPLNAESLLFDGMPYGLLPFGVSLGGETLTCVVVGAGVDSAGQSYNIYGADISAFAGQVETLTFSGSAVGILDDIQFSASPVPEPGVAGLFALGGGALIYLGARRRRGGVDRIR